MAHEQAPDYENVVFLDEYPQFIERRRVREMLGQLTLAVNTDPGQLFLFTGAGEELPDQPA